MIIFPAVFLLSLAHAQTMRPALEAPLAPAVPVIPAAAVPGAAAFMPLPASILPAPALPGPALPLPAMPQRLGRLSEALQPDIAAARDDNGSHEEGRAAAGRLFAEGLGGAPGAVPVPGVEPSGRSAPLLKDVSFSEDVGPEARALFTKSLTRRKAGWISELGKVGVKLIGPVAPALDVRAAFDRRLHGALKSVDYRVEWTQGPTRAGAFIARIRADRPDPRLTRAAEPQPPLERQVQVRFRAGSAEADIARFLEERGLRLLRRDYRGFHVIGVSGQAAVDEVARDLARRDLVLYATPSATQVPEQDQLIVVFKNTASESDRAAFLAEYGLRVLEADPHRGFWRVGAERLYLSGAEGRIRGHAALLYASPLEDKSSWTRHVIVSFREDATDDAVADFLRRNLLRVVSDYGGRTYKAAALDEDPVDARELAEFLAGDGSVKSAVAVGTLDEAAVERAADYAIGHKGMPWSMTEFEMVKATTEWDLDRRGATPEQLARYRELVNAADVKGGRFNPWSGD